jgi:hypothetical protein
MSPAPALALEANAGVGTKRICRGRLTMSAREGKTDVPREPGHFLFDPGCLKKLCCAG